MSSGFLCRDNTPKESSIGRVTRRQLPRVLPGRIRSQLSCHRIPANSTVGPPLLHVDFFNGFQLHPTHAHGHAEGIALGLLARLSTYERSALYAYISKPGDGTPSLVAGRHRRKHANMRTLTCFTLFVFVTFCSAAPAEPQPAAAETLTADAVETKDLEGQDTWGIGYRRYGGWGGGWGRPWGGPRPWGGRGWGGGYGGGFGGGYGGGFGGGFGGGYGGGYGGGFGGGWGK
ncbi:hypothetical protein EVAR_78053_1 [Eumeta japonica]|uniref:Uncharacterized protein n=1 Tax=Eumeta variegata TaxID=151549 RepID=A0A4C1T0A8_EUMVA|nr:hypothetical protein EVAR_78053_1 [Eumeta japonica]